MPELKLSKLPDRTPVKIAITVMPELHQALRQYAGIYRATYGESESVAELIPFTYRISWPIRYGGTLMILLQIRLARWAVLPSSLVWSAASG
jgi:hypothetical protein